MHGQWRRGLLAGLLGAAVMAAAACSGRVEDPLTEADTPREQSGGDAGGDEREEPADGGAGPVTPDAGPGKPDAGPGTPDAGPVDAGPPTTDTGKPQTTFQEELAPARGWAFYGEAEGAPGNVLGASEDEGGNLWVAGGEEGLFLLKQGSTTFRRYTMADGLQPYGLWKGSVPRGNKRLKVISVTGGPAGVVFVGYEGLPNCESEAWKAPGQFEDPNIFKSGDADRVVLQADGTLRVFHYDLHSPGHTVPGYGHREKLCTVNRIVWDKARHSVWFAANHGLAWGEADYEGGTDCQREELRDANLWLHAPDQTYRQRCNNGVMEHVHPAVETEGSDGADESRLAGDVWGVAIRPDGDVWMGTHIRTSRFRIMTNAEVQRDGAPWDFEAARKLTEEAKHRANRIDVWPPAGGSTEVESPDRRLRTDDLVSGLVLMSDQTVYVSSSAHGLAQLDGDGKVLRRLFEGTEDRFLSALGRDTSDESLWLGHAWIGGVSRIQGGKLIRHGRAVGALVYNPVRDIQFSGTGPGRKVIVSFGQNESGRRGGVGIYTGE